MEDYIKQLISDLRQARNKITPPSHVWTESEADPTDPGELEDMSYVEEFVYGQPQEIGIITGIEHILLPPPEQLTAEQMTILAQELQEVLEHFNFTPDFPDKLPLDKRYPLLRELWATEQVHVSFGTVHIELCNFDEENCPFPEYCSTCKEFREEEESEKARFSEEDRKKFLDKFPTPDDIIADVVESAREWEAAKNKSKTDDSVNEDDDLDGPPIPLSGGFYDDDGNKIHPDSVPTPPLCTICFYYDVHDPEDQNILCLMYRYNQSNSKNFECYNFCKK